MPSDDPFSRPDVRALLEAVAAGDDPTARLVLWDLLEELGCGAVGWCRGLTRLSVTGSLGPGRYCIGLSDRDGSANVILRVRDRIGRRRRPRSHVLLDALDDDPVRWPAMSYHLSHALALAADRLAARAAAKE